MGLLQRTAHALRQPTRARLDIPDGNEYHSDDAWAFHVFQKTLLHIGLRFIRTPPPEKWPDLFTGPRKEFAQFLLEEYFPYERQDRREIILEKVLYFWLKMWEYDNNYCEVFDCLLYRLFTKKGLKFHFPVPQYLDPANWYMDHSLHPSAKGQGARNVIPDGAQFFRVVAETPEFLTVDIRLNQSDVILRDMNNQFNRQRMRIDLSRVEKVDAGWKYPILKRESVIDLVNLMPPAEAI